jgi:ribose/xylose/arabinose/galactoside ABC-type transport system permease subunit
VEDSARPDSRLEAGGATEKARPAASARGFGLWARRLVASEYLVLLLSVFYFLAMLPVAPGFGSRENLFNILSSLLPLFALSIGQTFVLITGGIDLSVTAVVALSSVAGAAVMSGDSGLLRGGALAVPGAIVGMLMVGGILGGLNGLAVSRLRMPAFIVTLTSMMFFSGFAVWATHSRNISNLPSMFNAIGSRTLIAGALVLSLALGAHFILSHSIWGRWLYATGQNPRAAVISGVPVNRLIPLAYIASGICAAVASILYTGRLETGSPVLGQRVLLDVIGATVIGGTSLYGGKGKIAWAFFGVLFLTLLDNSLNLLNLSYFSIMMVKGAVILLAALLDTARSHLKSTVSE